MYKKGDAKSEDRLKQNKPRGSCDKKAARTPKIIISLSFFCFMLQANLAARCTFVRLLAKNKPEILFLFGLSVLHFFLSAKNVLQKLLFFSTPFLSNFHQKGEWRNTSLLCREEQSQLFFPGRASLQAVLPPQHLFPRKYRT